MKVAYWPGWPGSGAFCASAACAPAAVAGLSSSSWPEMYRFSS